jgi:hypothetical protein
LYNTLDALNGQYLLTALTDILFVTAIPTIIIRTAWITASDKTNEDLMFYSSLKPSAIVFGKIISGIVFSLLLTSITSPFVTLAYLSRGVDINIIALLLIFTFVCIQLLNCFAILCGSIIRIWFAPYLVTLIVSGVSFAVCAPFMTATYNMVYESYFFIDMIFPVAFVFGIIFVLLIYSTIAMFSTPASNRILPLRILLTVIFIVTFLLISIDVFYSVHGIHGKELFIVFSLAALSVLILLTACERDQWSVRIRQSLPKSLICRILLFPFYTGAACGIAWIFMMALAIFIIYTIWGQFYPGHLLDMFNSNFEINTGLGIVIFIFNYSMTAMLIRSWFLKKLNSMYVVIIAVILFIVSTLGTMLLYSIITVLTMNSDTISDPFWGYSTSVLSIFNPYCDIANTHLEGLRMCGMSFWFIVLILQLIKWYAERIKDFNPDIKKFMINYNDAIKIIQNENPQDFAAPDLKLDNA